MASIRETADKAGNSCFVVHYQQENTCHGRRKKFNMLDEAARFFYEIEASALGWRTIEAIEARKDWTLKKLVWFFLGYQSARLHNNVIQITSFEKCRYALLAIKGDILNKPITKISTREFQQSASSAGLGYLRSAFGLLIKMRLLDINPIFMTKKHPRKPITIPSKHSVTCLLNNYGQRERISTYLGAICGLRIGEALAVTYDDISEKYITVNKHITKHGVTIGLKRGIQRRIPMPRGLWNLLDMAQLGTKKPLIAHAVTGNALTYAYVYDSPLKVALDEQGVKRFHDLRHFAVSRLAERGIDIVRVSKLIGHSRPSITMDIYGHLFGDIAEMDLD